MLPDRVSNPGPLTYESGALPIALRGPACYMEIITVGDVNFEKFSKRGASFMKTQILVSTLSV